MKKTSLLLIVLSALLVIPGTTFAQKKNKKKNAKQEACFLNPAFTNNTDTISYIIGADIAKSFKNNDVQVSLDMMNLGFKAAMQGADTIFSQEQIQTIMTAWNQRISRKSRKKPSANRRIQRKGANSGREQEERRSN
jgi:hypothetical protein